jgi:hypothetical protein
MPKVLKTKRRKTKTKTIRKAKAKTIRRAKAKTQKKTKVGTTTMRVSQPLKLPDEVKRDEPSPMTNQIDAAAVENKSDQLSADVVPTISYKLEVDGRSKSEYPTQEAAMTAALQLKRKYPQIRVAIVDSKGQKRIPVELPQAAA